MNTTQTNSKLVTRTFNEKTVIQLALLTFVTLIAVVLRFYKLGQWSFWGDEYITVTKAMAIFDKGLDLPPIALLGTRLALDLWGISEWSARLTPAVIGILTIPILFFLIRRMFDTSVALIASLILAVAPWHIYWSQNARFYTLLLLFFSLAILLFFFAIEEDRPWLLILSLIFFGLAMRERFTAGFFVPIIFAYIILLKLLPFDKPPGLRSRNLIILLGFSTIGAIYFLYPYIIAPERFASNFVNPFTFVNNNPIWILGGVVFYLGIPLVCMSSIGGIFLLLNKNRAGLILSLAVIVPLISIIILSPFIYTANRYVFVSITSVIILAAFATKEIIYRSSKQYRLLAIGVLMILLLAPMADNMLYYRYQNGNRDDWRAALTLISNHIEPNDLVVTANPKLSEYYLNNPVINMRQLSVSDIMQSGQRMWFIVDLTSPDKAPQVNAWVEQNASPVANFDVNVSARTFPMRVYLYDPLLYQQNETLRP